MIKKIIPWTSKPNNGQVTEKAKHDFQYLFANIRSGAVFDEVSQARLTSGTQAAQGVGIGGVGRKYTAVDAEHSTALAPLAVGGNATWVIAFSSEQTAQGAIVAEGDNGNQPWFAMLINQAAAGDASVSFRSSGGTQYYATYANANANDGSLQIWFARKAGTSVTLHDRNGVQRASVTIAGSYSSLDRVCQGGLDRGGASTIWQFDGLVYLSGGMSKLLSNAEMKRMGKSLGTFFKPRILSLPEAVAVGDTNVLGITDSLVLAEGTANINAETNVLGITVALVLDDTALADIDISADTEVTGITHALTLAEGTAVVNATKNIQAIIDTLILAEGTATINLGIEVQTITDSLILAEGLAGVNAETNVTGITNALALTEGTATIKLETNIQAITQVLTLAEGLAGINAETNITTIVDALILTEGLATISLISGTQVIGITDELVLAAGVAEISLDRNIFTIVRHLVLNDGGIAFISLAGPPLPASSNSVININLGNVPEIDDPQVYEAVLEVHSAIEAILEYLNDQ